MKHIQKLIRAIQKIPGFVASAVLQLVSWALFGLQMLRGEIRLVNLDPTVAGEAAKTRPAVIVSNDALNAVAMSLSRGVVTVVPITSNTKKVYPFQVELDKDSTGLSVQSKAQAEQIRAVSISRIGRRIGVLNADLQQQLDVALRLHLNL